MNWLNKILKEHSLGQISLSFLFICLVSGVLVAIPYDIENAYNSIAAILIQNPFASLIRNLHFWSAQFFLVFTLIHIWDYFLRKEKIRLKKGIWFRLSIGIIIIFMAMLSGFLLKDDADSKQAYRILNSLLLDIPLLGKSLAASFLGKEGNLQLVYIHHIATLTIFIVLINIEHSRKIWPKLSTLIIIGLLSFAISWLLTAPLHDILNPVVKGPWYFVGFQEILHWMSGGRWALVLVLIFISLIYLFITGGKTAYLSKRSLLILSILYLVLSINGMFFRGEYWNWTWPWEDNYKETVLYSFNSWRVDFNEVEKKSGLTESCLICHGEMEGFSQSHSPEAVGCYSCHGGNKFSSNKEIAHANMINIPGNFSDANRSCGTTACHPDITQRKGSNLMSNLSGMISVDKYVFVEQDNPDVLHNVKDLQNSAADEHLKNLCVVCHLDNKKTETGPINEKSRGGGCLACHLNYNELSATAVFNHKKDDTDSAWLKYHPAINMQVSDNHCFGCHSRSGRISTNYEGWHETTMEKEQMPDSNNYRLVEGTRVFTYKGEDVHHKLGLGCIDCHTSYELMGDGNLYSHQEKQRVISCSDCHFNIKPKTAKFKQLDTESAKIASMRFENASEREYILTKKRSHALINTDIRSDTAKFYTKNKGIEFLLKAPAEECSRGNVHSNLSCSACHSAWAPSCIGCHNEYDENEPGYDMLKAETKTGSWVEYTGLFNAHLPALGVRESDSTKEILTVVPGMVLTIDKQSYSKQKHDSLLFRRLFAPAVPHTTSKSGRSCKSCHFNPQALGYGDGVFKIDNSKIIFNSKFQNNSNDNLPEDAWIDFLSEPSGSYLATRSDLRPFSLEEQKKILRIGVCLNCHEQSSIIIQTSLVNSDSLYQSLSPKCIDLF